MFNILIADDQVHIRRLYEHLLEKNGYKSFCAGDGQEALDILETVPIDLIILDIMMPKMDGYTFLKTLRECGYNTPVLVITARSASEDIRNGFILGTDDYMVKPVDEMEMILRVKALLRRAKISEEQKITIGNTTLLYDSLTVKDNETEMILPKKEFQILLK